MSLRSLLKAATLLKPETTDTSAAGAYDSRVSVGTRCRRAAADARARNALLLGVMGSPPTITTGTSNLDATLTKSYRTSAGQTSSFRITGGTPTQLTSAFAAFLAAPVVTMPSGSGGNVPNTATKTEYGWSVEFMTDAPKVMLRYLNGSNPYMIEVDDQPVSAAILSMPGGGGTAYSLLDFTGVGGSAVRKIRVEYTYGQAFDGVYVGPTYSIWAPVSETNLRVTVVGDSIETGTGTTLPNAASSKVLGKLLGWTDVRQVAFGGTGAITVGSYNTFGAALRVADAVATNPDLLILRASQNDDGQGQAAITAAALTVMQAYRAALPNVPIVVVGVDASSSGPSALRLTTEAAWLAAFTSWADSNSFWIPDSNDPTGAWETGTGTAGSRTVTDAVTNSTTTVTSATAAITSGDFGHFITGAGIPAGTTIVGPTTGSTITLSQAATASASGVSLVITNQTGSGNRDRYGYDAPHPNDLGHKYIGYRLANAFRSLVLPALK